MKLTLHKPALVGLAALALTLLGSTTAHADDTWLPTYPYLDNVPDLAGCPALLPMIYKYSNGTLQPEGCVAALQQSLQAVGYGRPLVTGDYEADTWVSVYNFQAAQGLPATGTADVTTILTLDRIANSPAALSGNNGANVDGTWRIPIARAPISTVHLQSNLEPPPEEPPDDCATTCDEEAP